MANPKRRLDLLAVEKGLFFSRAKAQAAIMAGKVLVDGCAVTKAGTPISPEAQVSVAQTANPYVSRGGLKLAAALAEFKPELPGRICLDVGASTGGFTDCLLQNGADRVFAVDVGHGQLDLKLRKDARVVSREKTHARDITPEMFVPSPDLAVIDVSFISLTGVLPAVLRCLKRPFEVLALIKPQFELSPKEVPKGIVRDPENRLKAIARVRDTIKTLPVSEAGVMQCPVHGPKGNVEFFMFLRGD